MRTKYTATFVEETKTKNLYPKGTIILKGTGHSESKVIKEFKRKYVWNRFLKGWELLSVDMEGAEVLYN